MHQRKIGWISFVSMQSFEEYHWLTLDKQIYELKQFNVCFNNIQENIQNDILIILKVMNIKKISKGYFESINEFLIPNEPFIGGGSFGTVKKAVHIKTNKFYALKILNCKDMSLSQTKIIQRQIRLHSKLDHPHIIKLWDTFQQGDNIYMVLQLAENGSLFSYQNQHKNLSEWDSYTFFYQTLNALQYLHNHNIIHRDIKPENILIDSQFNIKICDFGWAAQDIHQKRSTFCGTYEYMAPQMIYSKFYDYKIDIWALGVLLYQLIHGYAPFKAKSLQQIKIKLEKGYYQINNSFSKEIKDLILWLLQFQPENRPSLQQIINHKWIQKQSKIILDERKKILKKGDKCLVTENQQMSIIKLMDSEIPKHKKYESNNLDSSLKGNFFKIETKKKGIEFQNNKKQSVYKKLFVKKCKTQGEQKIQKIQKIQKLQLKRNSQVHKLMNRPKIHQDNKQNYFNQKTNTFQLEKQYHKRGFLSTSKIIPYQLKIFQTHLEISQKQNIGKKLRGKHTRY